MPTPNFIKYSITPDDKSIKVGNYSIGVASGTTYGPTSGTSYWSGISPPTSGYTIYENKVTNGPSIRVPSSSAVLIDYANRLYGGSSITTEAGALVYFNSLNTVICVNRNYEEIVTSGLTLLLDAGFTPSYPKSGTSWTDLSFSGNNGTLINGPTFNSSNGGSIVFDGSDDYATVPHNSNINLVDTVSLEAWVKYTTTSNTVLIEKSNNNTHYQFQIFNSGQGSPGISGQLVFMLQPTSSNWVVSGIVTNDGNWHHVVGTYDRGVSTAKIYVNGVLRNTNSSILSGPTSNTQPLLMGSRSGAAGFGGSISGVKIYNRALSAAEISQNYNATKSRYNL